MSILDALSTGERDSSRVFGVAAGMVTNNHDPDGMGRVKVKFPWLSDDNETGWVRIATLMAGKERGTFFLPEVGDEVLVAFEHGDINRPYVIGSLWNGEAKPPETNSDGKNNIRLIHSRSGHEIILNDDETAKKEKIEIHTKGKHKIVLDDTAGQEKIEINTNAKHKIVLDDTAGQEKIEVVDKTGSNKITIDSMQNSINIESSMKLKIKSQMIEIEAGGMMTLKSSGVLTIQGSIVKIN